MKYRIAWKYKRTERTFRGEPIFDSYTAADQSAKDHDRQYPGLEHWVEPVDDAKQSADELNGGTR